MNSKQIVRIGGGAGFWGDTAEGPRQLVERGDIDYLMLDYLAEITMSILSRLKRKDPALGFATDFPELVAALAPAIKAKGIKVITNAGGVNPQACKADVEARLKALGIDLTVGLVTGDDLLPNAESLRAKGVPEMFSGDAFPEKPWSINAYLGAFPIAAALDAGADIVITGRCVDSALALGPLIHEFQWTEQDYDKLAGGSLAGHVIECGTQATGGVSTDWHLVADDWDRMGFPIAECRSDGSFVLTKPVGTGGLVTPATVSEQIVYEIGDPAAYVLPDVVCDFRDVTAVQVGEDRVEVVGARGYQAPSDYKVSATYQDGFRCTGTMLLGGIDAVPKARRIGEALLARTRRLMAEAGYGDYRRTDIEVLGGESNWGSSARAKTREVVLKIALHHDDKRALEFFAREVFASATSMAQGITGFAGGRPAVTPLVRLFSCLVTKDSVAIAVEVADKSMRPHTQPVRSSKEVARVESEGSAPVANAPIDSVTVPLIAIAYGRSGDKGNHANIGVLSRRAEFLPLLRGALTSEAVNSYFRHFVQGAVTRYELPGLMGFNFLMQDALGGGGVASLRYDPQGKMLAQVLMSFPVQVPRAWLVDGWLDTSLVDTASK
ncbi:Acyclic terpene utilization family protein AtuA [compost metagenome]